MRFSLQRCSSKLPRLVCPEKSSGRAVVRQRREPGDAVRALLYGPRSGRPAHVGPHPAGIDCVRDTPCRWCVAARIRVKAFSAIDGHGHSAGAAGRHPGQLLGAGRDIHDAAVAAFCHGRNEDATDLDDAEDVGLERLPNPSCGVSSTAASSYRRIAALLMSTSTGPIGLSAVSSAVRMLSGSGHVSSAPRWRRLHDPDGRRVSSPRAHPSRQARREAERQQLAAPSRARCRGSLRSPGQPPGHLQEPRPSATWPRRRPRT